MTTSLPLYPQNPVLCGLGNTKFNDSLGWNLDLLLGLGIEARARFPLLLYELSEARQDEFTVLFDRFVCERTEPIEKYSSRFFVGLRRCRQWMRSSGASQGRKRASCSRSWTSGCSQFATTSDGEKIANPRFLKSKLPELRRAQRSLSRKKKGGRNGVSSVERSTDYTLERLTFAENTNINLISKIRFLFDLQRFPNVRLDVL